MADLTFQFLDVGQGDGIFVTFPNGKTMLVDLGSTKNKDLTNWSVLKYFRTHTKFTGEARQDLDYLVLTHGDRDHYNMIRAFTSELKVNVKNLLYGGLSSDYGDLIKGLNASQIFSGGGAINVIADPRKHPFDLAPRNQLGGVETLVLTMNAPSPSLSTEAWRKNTSSVVLQLKYADVSVILSGDATIDTEAEILKTFSTVGNLTTDLLESAVLKVAHHGSARTSIRPTWVEAVQPSYVFISSDRSGSLSPEAKPTGHRLPQELCVDLIRDNTDLAADVVKHAYVSSYAPADYAEYEDPDGAYEDGVEHFLTDVKMGNKKAKYLDGRQWIAPETTEGVFTTLATMGLDEDADQGAQYELSISDAGAISIKSTFDYLDHVKSLKG